MRVCYTKDGKAVDDTRYIDVKANDKRSVNFTRPEPKKPELLVSPKDPSRSTPPIVESDAKKKDPPLSVAKKEPARKPSAEVPATAPENAPTPAVSALAAEIKELLDVRGETTIHMGEFRSAPRSFVKQLSEELARRKITLDKKAKLTVHVRYRHGEDKDADQPVEDRDSDQVDELLVTFVNQDDDEIGGLTLRIRKNPQQLTARAAQD